MAKFHAGLGGDFSPYPAAGAVKSCNTTFFAAIRRPGEHVRPGRTLRANLPEPLDIVEGESRPGPGGRWRSAILSPPGHRACPGRGRASRGRLEDDAGNPSGTRRSAAPHRPDRIGCQSDRRPDLTDCFGVEESPGTARHPCRLRDAIQDGSAVGCFRPGAPGPASAAPGGRFA